jgi:hypothetical protein
LLIAPVIIHIDTDNQYYSVRIPILFSTRLEISEYGRRLRNRVFFIPFSIGFGKRGDDEADPALEPKTDAGPWYLPAASVSPRQLRFYLNNAMEFIRSFRLKRLSIQFDTGDFTLNARLVPVIMLARRLNVDVSVNFIENNSLIMVVQNRIYRLLWHGIKFYFNYKKLNNGG